MTPGASPKITSPPQMLICMANAGTLWNRPAALRLIRLAPEHLKMQALEPFTILDVTARAPSPGVLLQG